MADLLRLAWKSTLELAVTRIVKIMIRNTLMPYIVSLCYNRVKCEGDIDE